MARPATGSIVWRENPSTGREQWYVRVSVTPNGQRRFEALDPMLTHADIESARLAGRGVSDRIRTNQATSAPTHITKRERLRLAAIAAPYMRSLSIPPRRIAIVDRDGNVTRYTDSHRLAKRKLRLFGIEFGMPNSIGIVCEQCGKHFVSTCRTAKFCSRPCSRKTHKRLESDRKKTNKQDAIADGWLLDNQDSTYSATDSK